MARVALLLILPLSLFVNEASLATGLEISEPIVFIEEDRGYQTIKAKMQVSWSNAWHSDRNHDAAWVVLKFVPDSRWYTHLPLLDEGHLLTGVTGDPNVSLQVTEDGVGFYLLTEPGYRGDIDVMVTLAIDTSVFRDRNPWGGDVHAAGVEMVYVPAGPLFLGDHDSISTRYGAYYASDNSGNPAGSFRIDRDDAVIEVGPEDGKLWYFSETEIYQGDQQGPIPASFPKGVNAFYIMKYELTQGLYAQFLNTLSENMTQYRVNFGVLNYYKYRGTLRIEGDKYVADSPSRPLNYYTWDDAMAVADWLGLRPYTEFEFTKACRGSNDIGTLEYPWGEESKHNVLRQVYPDDELRMPTGWEESMLNDANRHVFGASYYWVMDLAGSVWERVVTPADSIGRAFTGSHGDGMIDGYGYATNEDWPAGNQEDGGFGFRGGGYYNHDRPYTVFNPYSPIAFRLYGAWSGGSREKAYGGRFARTAD